MMLLVSALTGCGSKVDTNGDASSNQTENEEQPCEVAKVSYHKAAENFAGGSGTEWE